jgi:peptide/nickel transport system ATP-binding protein
VMERCRTELPPRFEVDPAGGSTQWAACWLYEPAAPQSEPEGAAA